MTARAFADNEEDILQKKDDSKPQEQAAEYVFEGFQIDFSEKIALTPPVMAAKGQKAA